MNRLRASSPLAVMIRTWITALQIFALLTFSIAMPIGMAAANGPIGAGFLCSPDHQTIPSPVNEGPKSNHDCVCSFSSVCGSVHGPNTDDPEAVRYAPPILGFVVYDALFDFSWPILEIRQAPRGPPTVS